MAGECRRRTSRGQPEYPSARSSGSTPAWIDDVAPLPEAHLDRIADRWIDLIEYEECDVATDDKPMLRGLAGDLVALCHRAEGAEDVLFARSLKWRSPGCWPLAGASVLVAQLRPCGPTRSLDQLDQNAMAALRVDESHRALSTLAWGRVDENQVQRGELVERCLDVWHLEADVVEALALGCEEASGAGRVVGRLDQLDLGVAHRQEADRDVVVVHVHHGFYIETELVSVEIERRVDEL